MSGQRKHPVLNVAQQIMYTFRWTIIFYWIIFILAFVGVGMLLNAEEVVGDGVVVREVWEGASVSSKIFLFVIGILLTPTSLASFVSSGVTRRHYVGGVSLVLASLSAIFALVLTVGFPIEQFIYDKYDWQLELQHPHLYESSSQIGWILVEYFSLFFAYFGSGWLIGSGFYRFHWRVGILISLVALLPAVAMEAVLSSDWAGRLLQSVLEVERSPIPVVLLLAVIIMALLLLLNFLILRRVAIKKKLF